jgi:hypothetical protein
MIRLKPPVLRLESLEDRAVPAVFGEPWLDGRHLTLSFAPDGTSLSGVGSNLQAALSPLGWDAAKMELLRAFQTWVVSANLNVGVVNDSGEKFGKAGAIERDPRFGDIRIGARTLGSDVLAITSPFSLITPTAGDLILNSGKAFAFGNQIGKYDLFTVAMQESGHTFGIGNSVDPNSVMYEVYGSARAGLSANDIADVRALYGARAKDGFEGSGGNETTATATSYSGSLEADITNTADVDVYRYTAANSGAAWFRVKAAKLSLVAAKVEVLNAAEEVVGFAEAAGPLQNDVTVYVDQLVAGETYYVRVAAARSDVFGVGAYRLVVDSTESGSSDPDPYALVDAETDANNTPTTATEAVRSTTPYDYSFRSSLSNSSDVDFFRIRSPATANTNLNVTVSGVGMTWFNPNVDLYTTSGVKLTTKVVAQTDTSVVLSLEGVAAGTEYLVRVASGLGTVGNYDVVADFRINNLPKMMGSRGNLNSGHMTTSATLTVWESQTLQINQLATAQNGTNTYSQVRIYDSLNRVAFELYSQTGVLTTGHVFLRRGLYRVEVVTIGDSIDYSLTMFGVTDPIATPGANPTDNDDVVLPSRPDPTTTVAITPPSSLPSGIVWF